MEKEAYFERALNWARQTGFYGLKANYEGYETPNQFTNPEEEQPYTPDITGNKTGGKSYIEIALKADNVRRRVSKWKLLNTLANMKGGKLFLLAPRGHKTFVEDIVKNHHLNAKIVYLK
jgi:hypothetical protein